MRYHDKLEVHQPNVSFGFNDPCVWIVYPPGAAGDLVASIVNFHYFKTGANFYGIRPSGQICFRSTDKKVIDLNYISKDKLFDQNLLFLINDAIGNESLDYSKMDQVIFSSHYWQDKHINHILDNFKKSKIIKILPKTSYEKSIIDWLAAYKNQDIKYNLPTTIDRRDLTFTAHDDRVLTLFFGDLLKEYSFELCYQKILHYLDLEFPLIRYDFIKFWLANQHPYIIPYLEKI